MLDIPFCVAGGIRSVADAEAVLNAGADKISVNSPALADPALIDRLARRFGSQCVVVGIDSQTVGDDYRRLPVHRRPGRARAARRADTLDWVREAQDRGAGEIVLNCMASDGVRTGYDLAQLRAVREACRVPLIASGGAGALEHFAAGVQRGARGWRAGGQRVPLRRDRDPRPEALPARATASRCGCDPGRRRHTRLDQGRRTAAGDRAARAHRPRADARLHERGRAARDAGRAAASSFYSRSRETLWIKGETSGHFLNVVDVSTDCDSDALLVLADPVGPTCHKGTESCFADAAPPDAQRLAFLALLENIIANRIADQPDGSYTAKLFAKGPSRIAQKVGEEGVETALAAVTRDDAGAGQRVRRPAVPPAGAAQVARPAARAGRRGTQGAARIEGLSRCSARRGRRADLCASDTLPPVAHREAAVHGPNGQERSYSQFPESGRSVAS